MRIHTCTPVAFGGGADFFARDSGLLCRGLQAIGVESRAVMPGERKPGDEADLIRTAYRNLESAEWWRCQDLDAVVLYAWGRPKFRKVAAAIHKAGVFLILNQDTAGLASPLAGWRDWLHAQWIYGGQGRGLESLLRFFKLVLRGASVGMLLTDPLRALHLKQGDTIACVSPEAASHYRKLCRIYGGTSLAGRVTVIPHAVEPGFRPSDALKRRRIVCVGRWQDVVQKRPWLLTEVIGRLAASDENLVVTIVGTVTPQLESWHGALNSGIRNRVLLKGFLGREALAEILAESEIFYSPSAFESFGIAAAEALCAGCSVVAGRSITMPAFEWFVSEASGRLAVADDLHDHVRALREELESWKSGERDARRISSVWSERLHADRVAARIVERFEARSSVIPKR